MGRVSAVAPHRERMGAANTQNRAQNTKLAPAPHQKEMAAISRALSGALWPKARARALAPPTPKRLEMAVSIRKGE